MSDYESNDPIKLYLDDDSEPFKVAHPPLTYQFNTIALTDGQHRLRIEASNGLAPPTVKEIPFVVRNGVAVTVSGLDEGQTIAGQVQMVINAYAGNTEVDFEPARAETPQPIPTWAWVVLLGVLAWTMFYIINPTIRTHDFETEAAAADEPTGLRVWVDTCARCHGEDGRGAAPKVPQVRDSFLSLADSPAPLLIKVVASDKDSMMPEWGTRLTNDEIIAVVNHVRHSWGHDSSQILLQHRKPPAGIDQLNVSFSDALRTSDIQALRACCIPPGQIVPRLFRTDGVDVSGAEAVMSVWNNYFQQLAIDGAKLTKIALLDTRFDYDPATVEQDGSIVIATGRIFMETAKIKGGETTTAKGRFIRVYERGSGKWMLVFDFADIPMAVGCSVTGKEICDPSTFGPIDPPDGPEPPPASGIGYAEVQRFLQDLGKSASSSPHENFWEKPYEEFVGGYFELDWDPGQRVYYIRKGDSANSNLIRALREGDNVIFVTLPDGTTREEKIERMPKFASGYMPEERIQAIADWIDAGAPEVAGTAAPPPRDPVKPPGPSPTAPGASGIDGTRIGYADIQAMLSELKGSAPAAPHDTFWDLPYDEFVTLSFSEEWGDDRIDLIRPYDGPRSNLVKALRDGKGIVVRNPDGTTFAKDMRRMPVNGRRFATEDELARLIAWIDAGAPEIAGQPSTLPRPEGPGATPMVPAPADPFAPRPAPTPSDDDTPPPADPPVPAFPVPGGPPPAAPEAGLRYADVQALLRGLGKGPGGSPHEAFWELPYEKFVALSFPVDWGEEEEIRLLTPGDGPGSNLVKGLRDGKGIVVTAPDGSTRTIDIERMPKNAARYLSEADIRRISDWIDAGAPE